MWERDWIITEDNIGRKIKPTGYIYLLGSKYRDAEGHLKLRSCLQDAAVNYAPSIGKYV